MVREFIRSGAGVQSPGGFAQGVTVFRGLQPSEARPSREAKRGSPRFRRRAKRGRAKVIGRSPLQKNSKRFHQKAQGNHLFFFHFRPQTQKVPKRELFIEKSPGFAKKESSFDKKVRRIIFFFFFFLVGQKKVRKKVKKSPGFGQIYLSVFFPLYPPALIARFFSPLLNLSLY